jgi:hypothetical protein
VKFDLRVVRHRSVSEKLFVPILCQNPTFDAFDDFSDFLVENGDRSGRPLSSIARWFIQYYGRQTVPYPSPSRTAFRGDRSGSVRAGRDRAHQRTHLDRTLISVTQKPEVSYHREFHRSLAERPYRSL